MIKFGRIISITYQYVKSFNRIQTNDSEWIELFMLDINNSNDLTESNWETFDISIIILK